MEAEVESRWGAEARPAVEERGFRPPVWRWVHWAIIANLFAQCVYVSLQVFVVLQPGGFGPLGARALEIPHELMMTRRMYALEGWVAFGFLALYLALTEIAPRLATERSRKGR